MKLANALLACKIGVGATVALLVVEFCSFYLHLFVLPVLGLPFTVVLTLLPALFGISAYQRALKAEEAKPDAIKPE